MTKGYSEILEEMLEEYEALTGEELNIASPEHKRFEAIASELFTLSCLAEKTLAQSFVQSAEGGYLDRHAALRGLERKSAANAFGSLTFSLDEAAENDITVPAGTVCSVRNNPLLQYETLEEAVLCAGDLSVSVNAKSVQAGYRYNVPAGFVSVMVNAPPGISTVTNEKPFKAGKDAESDGHLRRRIREVYGNVQNGFNCASLENLVLSLDFVRDCYIPYADEAGIINVYAATQSEELTDENIEHIKSVLGVCGAAGVNVIVRLATEKAFKICAQLSVKAGFDASEAENQARSLIEAVCTSSRIGRPLELSRISAALARVDGLDGFEVFSPDAVGSAIYCNMDEYLYPEAVEVRVLE